MKKILTAGIIVAAVSIGGTAPALADHGHFVVREDRNGETQCRYIAEGQTSKGADDPGGHAFHEHVHTGQPGSDDHGTDFDKSDNEGRCDTVQR